LSLFKTSLALTPRNRPRPPHKPAPRLNILQITRLFSLDFRKS